MIICERRQVYLSIIDLLCPRNEMFLNEKRKKLKSLWKKKLTNTLSEHGVIWSLLIYHYKQTPTPIIFFDFFFVEFTLIAWPKNITLQSEKILSREEKSQTLERKNRSEILKGDRPQITSPLQPATSLSRSLSEIYRQIHRHYHHS